VTRAEAGGAQTFAASLAKGLRHRYEVAVAAHGPEGALIDACRDAGIEYHDLPHLVRPVRPGHDAAAAVEIRRLVQQVRPNIVQANSSKAGVLARLALAASHVPLVFTVHGWSFSGRVGLPGRAAQAVERLLAPYTDAFVCVSEWDRRLALERRVAPASRLHTIQNGVAAPEAPLERGGWPANPVLACVARLAPPKDILLLLRALTVPGLEPWRLRLVGDGPERRRVEEAIQELGLGERVETLGNSSDVDRELVLADALVLPTKSEGLPFSILEAMAASLPIVATRVGGVPELVVHEQTGLLVERDDVSGLAAALARLLEDGDAARRMGVAGHARARDLFSLERMVLGYEELFDTLLGRPRWAGRRRSTLERPPVRPPAEYVRPRQTRRPRLLVMVTGTEIGGAQTFVSKLAEGLREQYDVHVAANDPTGPLAERCRAEGIAFEVVSTLVRDIRPTADLAATRDVRALYARLKPDIVQLNSSKAAAVGRVAATTTRMGGRVVFTAHGWAFAKPGPSRYPYWAAEFALAPLADAIVCVSGWDRRLALSHGVGRPNHLHVIHNGIQVPPEPPRRGSWPDRPRIVCVARLSSQKDVPLLLEALARPGLEHWELDVFGGGPLQRETEERIAQLGIGDRVRLLGDQPDVVGQLPRYDVFALPSNWEGFPFSTIEAMGAALPVVASSVGGVPEQVVHGRTGYLVDRGDTDGFADALRRVDAAGNGARDLGLAGYELVRSRFGEARMIERYDALFRSLLERRSRD
jgi:glycosyltransferase involved in cell wall biosynthesis